MNKKISLIGRKHYKFNDNITLNIPTVNMVRGNNSKDEELFWDEVRLFTIVPTDALLDLEDMGINFEELSDYDFFAFLFMSKLKYRVGTKDLLFENLNIWELELNQMIVDNKPQYVFLDKNQNVIIDEQIYTELSDIICHIVGHEKTKKKKFGNGFARKKRLEYERKKRDRERNKADDGSQTSMFDGIILRLVCNANFPYNFETIGDVTITDLLYSLKQIEKDIQVSDLMQSRLVGNDLSKLPREQLSRFIL